MKKIVVCAVLAALLALAGCAGSGTYRGVNEEGTLISTAMPEVTVRPAENFRTVLAGHTSCLALQKNGFTGTINTQVWYGLGLGENAQLAMLLAECSSGWEWSVGTDSSDIKKFPSLLEMRGVSSGEPDFLVYVRSASADPWNRLLGENAWNGGIMVARTEWLSSSNREKVIVEYREPADIPVEDLMADPRKVNAFAERAKAAFALEKAAPAKKPEGRLRLGGMLSDSVLAPVLGTVSPALDYLGF